MRHNCAGGYAGMPDEAGDAVYTDPRSCVITAGKYAEKLTQEIVYREDLGSCMGMDQFDRINALSENGIIPYNIKNVLHSIRMLRNDAVHGNRHITESEAYRCVQEARAAENWYRAAYADKSRSKGTVCGDGGKYETSHIMLALSVMLNIVLAVMLMVNIMQ